MFIVIIYEKLVARVVVVINVTELTLMIFLFSMVNKIKILIIF